MPQLGPGGGGRGLPSGAWRRPRRPAPEQPHPQPKPGTAGQRGWRGTKPIMVGAARLAPLPRGHPFKGWCWAQAAPAPSWRGRAPASRSSGCGCSAGGRHTRGQWPQEGPGRAGGRAAPHVQKGTQDCGHCARTLTCGARPGGGVPVSLLSPHLPGPCPVSSFHERSRRERRSPCWDLGAPPPTFYRLLSTRTGSS